MCDNIFLKNPVKVVVYDPIKNINKHIFVFLGDVPSTIASACMAYKPTADAELKKYYGTNFKEKLGIGMNPETAWIQAPERMDIVGGLDAIPITDRHAYAYGASEFDESDIEELLNETPKVITTTTNYSASDDRYIDFRPGVEYVRDVHVFPEDNFSELKEKIYVACGIPAYRQHMFYISQGQLTSVYLMHAEGIYLTDIRILNEMKDAIHSVPIDKQLYDIRDSIKVEAQDTFKILGNELFEQNVVYIVDLAQFTHKLHIQLLDAVKDTYQRDLFYYGFIIKYWPQLTRECFYDYIIKESELQHKYPELAKNKTVLTSLYKYERAIIDQKYKNMARARAYAENEGITTAITQMSAILTANRTIINIRNLFDKLHVTRCLPEIHAYVEHDGKRYMLRKRHIRNKSDIQFPSGPTTKIGLTIAISLRKADQESFHQKMNISTMENEQPKYMFLNIWSNGRCHIKSTWNEEDEFSFAQILKIMKQFINPIFDVINKLGKFVFTSGNKMPEITRQNIKYQGLNICIFWKKVLMESTFKYVRSLWDAYMRAGITKHRNVQQYDKYEFAFRKGMFEYDTSSIERIITASNHITLSNYYDYLSNNVVKQKWDQNYDGRIIRLSHRTTDIRFEIIDIREREFLILRDYIIDFAYNASTNEIMKTIAPRADVKKLRKLREQDPELFNLKKHGSKRVYSIICQNQRQPLIYTHDELKNMDQTSIKKLTQYWNFTLNKPAYYGCPNKKYPHLSFIAGVHPKHYCLPCCNKKPQSADTSKKARLNAVCLKYHKFDEADMEGETTSSRHIIAYGKEIDIGRLSKIPQTQIKNMLTTTLVDANTDYYIYGVAQHTPGVENAGLIYSVAEALETSVPELVQKMAAALTAHSTIFGTLIGGGISEYFKSVEEVVSAMTILFINMQMFSIEGRVFDKWSELFSELLYLLFDISIVSFIDADGTGQAINLFASSILTDNITHGGTIPSKHIVLFKRKNRYYPMFALKNEAHSRQHIVVSRVYRREDPLVKLLQNMVLFGVKMSSDSLKIADLPTMKKFASDYKIIMQYINLQNLCYAVLLKGPSGQVYFPIQYSVYVSDNTPLSFDSYDRTTTPISLSDVLTCISEFNAAGLAVPIVPSHILEFNGNIVGLKTEYGIFYFTIKNAETALPVDKMLYDCIDVNKKIISKALPNPDNRSKQIGNALYSNYLYQIFLLEFMNFLQSERNIDIRKTLIKLIKDTDFNKDVTIFRRKVRETLKEYSNDIKLFQHQLITFYYSYYDKETLLIEIENTLYDFDKLTINRLKKLTGSDLVDELKIVATNFTVIKDFDSTGIRFPNIFMPCGETDENPGYCDRDKLIIRDGLDVLVKLLAADLNNPLKFKYIITNIWSDTITDWLNFFTLPTEIVTIYMLNE